MKKPTIVHVFTVAQSLLFLDGQPAFLNQRGYDVHVISAGGEEAAAFAEHQGIRHHVVPFTRRVTPGRDLLCLFKTYRILLELNPDIVHGNTPKAGLLSMVAAWLARIPVRIYEIHGFPFESRRGISRAGLIRLEWLSCRLATQVLAVSGSLRERALTEGIVADTKLLVMHRGSCNGVDAAEQFNPANLDPKTLMELRCNLNLPGRTIGFVGRLTRDKGIYELLEAWLIIRGAYPDVTLLLAGSAEADFSAFTQLRSDDRIRAVGHVSNIPYYYAVIDFLVLPTYREGLSNVLIEAAAMERPAVVARTTGTVDAVVDGETGLLCEPRSVDTLVRQLRWYLDNPATVLEHGKNARRLAQRDFIPLAIWTAKWQLYERLLAKAGLSVILEEAP